MPTRATGPFIDLCVTPPSQSHLSHLSPLTSAPPCVSTGKRCDQPDCDRIVYASNGKCRMHGGGPRCEEEGCDKSAIGRSGKCKGHGGGPRCEEAGEETHTEEFFVQSTRITHATAP